MRNFLSKPYRWAVIYSILLVIAVTYTLLDTFVIEHPITKVSSLSTEQNTNSSLQEEALITDNSYDDSNIKITIEKVREYNTNIYIADVQLSDVSYLKTAFANDVYGRNIKETTSTIAKEKNAVFAVNGDFYGFRDEGYVLRNGTVYRDTGNGQALVIDKKGDFSVVSEAEVSMQSLSDSNTWQVLSFGPELIDNAEITVDETSEVGRAMNSNPRTAIGQISKLHYIIIVSDGRTSENEGLSIMQLARVFKDKGCTIAYNLDGGGSSTMYFNGNVINNPTDGRGMSERKVSDIVYFGY